MSEIFDPIHGYIYLSELCKKFSDTPIFQRLGHIKQLSVSALVYSGADHTRKQHSFGVMHLARKWGKHLQQQHPDLQITDRIIDLLALAGLCHDIGHGPFSHVFDRVHQTNHEDRSIFLVHEIVHTYNLEEMINDEEVNLVCEMIHPSNNDRSWYFQIVSGVVDVDRMDYVVRDSKHTGVQTNFDYHRIERIMNNSFIHEDKLVFQERVVRDIESLLQARWNLHKRVYNHTKSVAFELMIEECIKMDERIIPEEFNLEQFLKLDDTYLRSEELNFEQKSIASRIYHRASWDLVFHSCSLHQEENNLNPEWNDNNKYVIYKRWIGMDTGNVHPISTLLFNVDGNVELLPDYYWETKKFKEFIIDIYFKN